LTYERQNLLGIPILLPRSRKRHRPAADHSDDSVRKPDRGQGHCQYQPVRPGRLTNFDLDIEARCDNTTGGKPKGWLNLYSTVLKDADLHGDFTVGDKENPVFFNQLVCTGNLTPIAFLLAKCQNLTRKPAFQGWIWIMIANNQRSKFMRDDETTLNVVSFLVFDENGREWLTARVL